MHRFVLCAFLAGLRLFADGTDPALDYVTVLSGGSGLSIARDGTGNIYVGGRTTSATFPATGGAFQTNYHPGLCQRGLGAGGPCYDVFVAKWDPTGTRLLWATYLGGSGDDFLAGMAVDAAGNVYLTGWTSSSDFPVTSGALQTQYHGASYFGYYPIGDAFVTKLNSSGTALVYSTYLGGTGSDSAGAIAVDATGNAYVTGETDSTDFPVTSGVLQPTNHGSNAFVVKVNATGTALLFSTCLGGSGGDSGDAIAVDANGVVYVGGNTHSTDFPTTPGAFQTSLHDAAPSYIGGGDGFLARIDPSGSTLLSSTYFGGNGGEQLSGISIDSSGQIYITGVTDSSDLPLTSDALKTTIGSGVCAGDGHGNGISCSDVFIARFDSSGTKLTYSTYLGGTYAESSPAISLDNAGSVYIAGATYSADFPATADAFQPCSRAHGDLGGSAFVTKFKPGGPLLYSTFLGGSGGASIAGIAVSAAGGIYVTGDVSPAYVPVPGAPNLFAINNDFPPSPVPLITLGAAESSGAFVSLIDPSRAAPASRITCIVNAASMLGGGIVPGEVVEIFGEQLGPASPAGAQLTPSGAVSTALGGVQVLFDGIPAPLISVQSQRIEAVVPYALIENGFQTNVQVAYSGSTTGVFPISVLPASPAVFASDGSGKGQAAVLNEDGTLNSSMNPALKGSVVAIFCTGLGAVRGPAGDGYLNAGGLPTPASQIMVDFGGYPAEVVFAGGAPGQVFGVFQINARLPIQGPSGPAVQVSVLVDGNGLGLTDLGLGKVTVAIK
jgi:uncharacterized protein (TIGR03437 family)